MPGLARRVLGFKPWVQNWKDEQGHKRCGYEPADDDDREGARGFSADFVREGHGEQPESGHKRGHNDGTDARERAFAVGLRSSPAPPAQFTNAFDQNHTVEHGNAEQGHEANERRNGKIEACYGQSEQSAYGSEWNHQQDQKGQRPGIEGDEEEEENGDKRDGNDDFEAFDGALLVLEGPGPF